MTRYIFASLLKKHYYYHGMRLILTLFVILFSVTSGYSQAYRYQSIFIFSFTRYIQWPEGYNQGDFEILVLGDAPILEELTGMAQTKKVGDRNIKITKISSPAEIRKCNIVYIPSNKSSQIETILSKINTQSILVVTEEPGLGVKGSNINFIVKDGKWTFELNQSAMTKQSFRVSNELSRLAIMI
jgi:hypothetical protein